MHHASSTLRPLSSVLSPPINVISIAGGACAVTTFKLPGCQDMWTVGSGKGEHAFHILSCRDSSSGFCTDGPTVFAGNLGANRFSVQVTADSVMLLQHTKLVQDRDRRRLWRGAVAGRVEETWRRHLAARHHPGQRQLRALCFLAPDFPHLPNVLSDATNRRQGDRPRLREASTPASLP